MQFSWCDYIWPTQWTKQTRLLKRVQFNSSHTSTMIHEHQLQPQPPVEAPPHSPHSPHFMSSQMNTIWIRMWTSSLLPSLKQNFFDFILHPNSSKPKLWLNINRTVAMITIDVQINKPINQKHMNHHELPWTNPTDGCK